MSRTTISIKNDTYQDFITVQADLMKKKGRQVSQDETIRELVKAWKLLEEKTE